MSNENTWKNSIHLCELAVCCCTLLMGLPLYLAHLMHMAIFKDSLSTRYRLTGPGKEASIELGFSEIQAFQWATLLHNEPLPGVAVLGMGEELRRGRSEELPEAILQSIRADLSREIKLGFPRVTLAFDIP